MKSQLTIKTNSAGSLIWNISLPHTMRAAREREVDTTVEGTPRTFSAIGIRLKDIESIPMVIRHQQWPWPADSIYLFGRDAQASRDGAQVFIEVFPLPDGTDKFQKELALYRKQKRGFLVEGCKFDKLLLLPRSVAVGFECESFQTRDGIHRRRIVHLFSAATRAVILVYSLYSSHFASSGFFRQVSRSLEIGKR
jgi:hypothetical protein